jgi:chorismate-pyruvate lyase
MELLYELKKIESKISLSPVHKILLITDGSVTRILEALKGEKIRIETQKQEIINADEDISELLNVRVGEEVNHRIVNLVYSGGVLANATSYTPISRLEERFKEKILRADIPIGKILSGFKMEFRRELKELGVISADKNLAKLFEVKENSPILKRNYNIIYKKEILLNITELFDLSKL